MHTVSFLLFDEVELLDIAGPLELLSVTSGAFRTELLGWPAGGHVRTRQGTTLGPALPAQDRLSAETGLDILLVPGGLGTRTLVGDATFLALLRSLGSRSRLVASVCTGSALLAAAGLLDGRRATANKRAFAWTAAQSTRVDWQPRARWVADGDRWTSSGVSAGMDMTAALIAEIAGPTAAAEACAACEYVAADDPDSDPFAP